MAILLLFLLDLSFTSYYIFNLFNLVRGRVYQLLLNIELIEDEQICLDGNVAFNLSVLFTLSSPCTQFEDTASGYKLKVASVIWHFNLMRNKCLLSIQYNFGFVKIGWQVKVYLENRLICDLYKLCLTLIIFRKLRNWSHSICHNWFKLSGFKISWIYSDAWNIL